jgi:hypothetical protein
VIVLQQQRKHHTQNLPTKKNQKQAKPKTKNQRQKTNLSSSFCVLTLDTYGDFIS